MELEFHQLDLRYEPLRRRMPEREKRLLASLAQCGQQAPIVVVGGELAPRVVVDGYKRIRALKQLKADTVIATGWELTELDALVLERLMRASGGDDVFEQGWLLHELQGRFDLSLEDLSRRFDKSKSWVSRRVALVEQLPEEIQARVRRGDLVPHAAMRYLVPLARANAAACVKLVAALGKKKPSTRQMGALYGAWLEGNETLRERLLSDPWLFLRAQEEARRAEKEEKPPAQQLIADLCGLGALCKRACGRARGGFFGDLSPNDRREVARCSAQTKTEVEALFLLLEKELG